MVGVKDNCYESITLSMFQLEGTLILIHLPVPFAYLPKLFEKKNYKNYKLAS